MVKLLVPRIDVESILKVNELLFKTENKRNKYVDGLYCTLYLILSQCNVQRRRFLERGFVSLYSPLLRDFLGRDYKQSYLIPLIECGVIEVDTYIKNGQKEWYYTSGQSFSFRIAAKYLENGLNKFYEVTDWTQVVRLNNHHIRYNNRNDKTLLEFFDGCFSDLSVDYPNAVSTLEKIKDEILADTTINENQRKQQALDMYVSTRATLDQLHFRTYRSIFRDDNTQRVFTPITSLKRELKPFLRYRGERLVVLDIANSQPFFINYLFTDEFKAQIANTPNDELAKSIGGFDIADVIANQRPQEIELFKKLTSEGKLYDYLIKQLEQMNIRFANRYEFKEFFFAFLYAPDERKQGELGIMRDLMLECFPTIMAYLGALKYVSYKHSSILMQRIESMIMIDQIAKYIHKEHRDIPFFTIHDSILCLPEHAQTVKKIMDDKIVNLTGVKATISIE